jgi:hypothetical protein
LFWSCDFSSCMATTSPVGTCVMRTAESVVLTLCPPGPGRTVDVDLEIVLVDLEPRLLGLRHDGDRRSRGVDAPLGFGHRDPLYPVRPALPLEDRLRTLTLDRERDVVVAAAVARVGAEHLPFEATVTPRSASASGRDRPPRSPPRRRPRPCGSRR